jgi:uncharacterized membrane protein YhaH (DUF805 family)
MLAAVFSFKGRVNRLQYLAGNVAVGATLVLLATLFADFIDLPPTAQPTVALSIDAVLLALAAPLTVWCGASLQVRRLRDIGCGPVLAIPAWIGVLVVAGMVTQGAAQDQVAVGSAINFAVLTCLFVWPGRRRDGLSSISRSGWLMALAPSPALARSPAFSTSARRLR